MHLLLVAILSFYIISCTSSKVRLEPFNFAIKVDYDSCKKNTGVNDASEVTRIIPKPLSRIENVAESACIEAFLGIGTLRNGRDSMEIRVWGNDSTHAFTDKERIIIIKSIKGETSAEVFYFRYVTNQSNYNLDSLVGYKIALTQPKSGWTELLRKLELLDLWKLPDDSDIEGYDLDTDEGGYTIEVATENWYKVYSYATPIFRIDDFPQAKTLVQIVELLKQEFELNSISNLYAY